jgi:GT2 family glycosyltransferase
LHDGLPKGEVFYTFKGAPIVIQNRPVILLGEQMELGMDRPTPSPAGSDTIKARTMPPVSVIVPVFNHVQMFKHTLDALTKQDYAGPIEIIVVDNGAGPELGILLSRYPNVLLVEEKQAGAYTARNRGIRTASANVLAFTDADCVPNIDWLRHAVETLARDKTIGFVGGRIDMTSSPDTQAAIYDFATAFPQRFTIGWLKYSVTANLLTTRGVIDAVGVFDPKFKSGGDREWCERVARAGYRTIYDDNAVVFHPARATTQEIYARVQRVEAGIRDRRPSNWECFLRVVKNLCPPLVEFYMIYFDRGRWLTQWQKLDILAFAYRVRLLRAVERLRLQLTTEESPRT